MRAGERRVRREPAEDHAFRTGVTQHAVGLESERNPVAKIERELEACRHDTDYHVRVLAEPEFASDHVGRAGEAPLPDVIADYHNGSGAWGRIGVPEVWRFDVEEWTFTFGQRQPDGSYQPSDRSTRLPGLTAADVLEQMRLAEELGWSRWNAQAVAWVRDVLRPRRGGGA